MSVGEGGKAKATHLDARALDRAVVRAAVSHHLFGMPYAGPTLGRYQLLRRIGAGGMGVVFEATDIRSGHRVALKVVRPEGAGKLGRLKREFRALCALYHPNLVQFHELVLEAPEPFLTMEFVTGEPWLEYVRPAGVLDRSRLLDTARQLIDAVSTLHAAGILHRDLKPSNVRVEPSGRLVVLDFGLAREVSEVGAAPRSTSGTPMFMSPERLHGESEGSPSDWYSVGVMLREALGTDPSRAAEPCDLEIGALCERMLQRDPAVRPSGAELRERLGLARSTTPLTALRTALTDGLFVGREHELERLDRVFARCVAGACVAVHVFGEPGIGKTSLVRRALERFRAHGPIIVLRSRCYEREAISYNAIDGLIDALAGEIELMSARSREELHAPLCHSGARELACLFPAVAHVLGQEHVPDPRPHDAQRARERACGALRALLQALATIRPLVVHLDDLQWGDADSAQILRTVLEDAAPAPMLIIASYRTADAEHSPTVQALRGAFSSASANVEDIALTPLPEPASLALGSALTGVPVEDAELSHLVGAARGNPLFVCMLARHGMQQERSSDTQPTRREVAGRDSLQSLLTDVIAELPAGSRTLLALCALANRPLHGALLSLAALESSEASFGPEHFAMLQGAGLLRSLHSAQGRAFETFHDRVREVVSGCVGLDQARRLHRALARASASSSDDPEFLAGQYEAAGEWVLATEHAERAGDQALATLALERAAMRYEQALRCCRGRRPAALVRKLADAKAYTSHCASAAELYLELAGTAEPEQALQLRLKSGEMLLRAGRMREHAQVIEPVLRAVGLGRPDTGLASRVWILWNLIRLRRRLRPHGAWLTPTRRKASPKARLQAEVCLRLGSSYAVVDPGRSGSLLLRGLLFALDSGTHAQLARGLAFYALLLTTRSGASVQEQDIWFDRAVQMADEAGDVETKAWVLFLQVLASHQGTRFAHGLHKLDQCQRWISARCLDSGWIVDDLDTGACAQLAIMGCPADLDARSRPALRRAIERGNEYDAAILRAARGFVWLAKDQPGLALAETEAVLHAWLQAGPKGATTFSVIAAAIWVKVHVLLYSGEALAAWHLLEESRPHLARGGYHSVNPYITVLPLFEATAALACAQVQPRREYLRAIDRCIAALRRMSTPFAFPSHTVLAAGRAQLQGRSGLAMELFARAAQAYEAQGLPGHAASADMRRAELLGGDAGKTLEQRALTWFRAQAIERPEYWTRMYAPVGMAGLSGCQIAKAK